MNYSGFFILPFLPIMRIITILPILSRLKLEIHDVFAPFGWLIPACVGMAGEKCPICPRLQYISPRLDELGIRYRITATYRGVEQLVAREAHNLKAAGSSPAPATFGLFDSFALS